MITEFLLNLTQTLVVALLDQFPDIPDLDTSAVQSFASQAAEHGGYAAQFIPIGAAATGALVVLTVFVGSRALALGLWALQKTHITG